LLPRTAWNWRWYLNLYEFTENLKLYATSSFICTCNSKHEDDLFRLNLLTYRPRRRKKWHVRKSIIGSSYFIFLFLFTRNCSLFSFISVLHTKYYQSDKMKNVIGRHVTRMGETRRAYRIFVRKT
jgi:hypothetical protein